MSPSEIRKETLKSLRATRKEMLSAGWMLQLETADSKTRKQAGLKLVQVNHAILKLENIQLSTIRDALLENEEELQAGTAALGKALEELDKVKDVLGVISGVLSTLGRIIKLL